MISTIARLTLVAGACTLAAFLSLRGAPVSAQQAPPPQLLLTPAKLAAYQMAAARGLRYLPGEVIVKFRTGVTVGQQTRAMSVLRSQPLPNRLQWIAERTARLSIPEDPDSVAVAASLARQPEVEYATPNFLRRPHAVPNDPNYGARQWNFTLLDLPRAWDINAGASGITVAVIDSGLTSTNATFPFKIWDGTSIITAQMAFGISPDMDAARIAPGYDFVFWPGGPVLDMNGHGTHVSGTVAQSTNNNLGYAGVAYNAKIMPLKVCLDFWEFQIAFAENGITGYPADDLGGCSDSALVAAIRHAADNGAKVINISLGGPDPVPAVRDALVYAVNRGSFVALSAGNDFEDGNPVTYPASYALAIPGVMAVGAVGRMSERASYSTTGEFVEIAAPGGNFSNGQLTNVIYQTGLFSPDFEPKVVHAPRFNRYTDFPAQGTSMASPHVAGVAALLMSQGITSPAAVEALIVATAKDLGTAGRDNAFGAGLVQPRAALRGFGVVR